MLDIATGVSARTKRWKNNRIMWSELLTRLSNPVVTNETYSEYKSADKQTKSNIKDVGGFVGGYLKGGERRARSVMHRQVLSLDLDFAHTDAWDDFTMFYSCEAVMHSTHSHHPSAPRFRLILPLSRPVEGDEYLAIGRKVAETVDMELFDETSFQLDRLMFWPSTPKDVDYELYHQEGEWLDVDEVLAQYVDWRDVTEWATKDSFLDTIKNDATKQEDPTLKGGLIGAFCRAYTIHEAIETFLGKQYVKAGEDRYTFKEGSTASGLVIYEEKFAYSHHGTDPASGQLCNAFDLVRLHKFGHLEGKASFNAMQEFVTKDDRVKKDIASERLERLQDDFSEPEEDDNNWLKELEMDKTGKYSSSASNINIIFANDPRLKRKFRANKFKIRNYVFGSLPWRKVKEPEPITNTDYSGVRNYFETVYGIVGSQKIEDSLNLEFERNGFHPVRDYLKALKWDGVERVDGLLIDYFGAEDNIYTREAMRRTAVGAVARVFNPGVKFDTSIILYGPQGCGKSTFIRYLAKHDEWFSDSLHNMNGKEAMEQIQGAWLIEMAELSAMRKAEVEATKHFTAKTADVFRPAYGRTTETFKRQCIFFGSTNKKQFLSDPTGNRRYFPISVSLERRSKDVFYDLADEVDQIWAEAVHLYRKKEPLVLSPEADKIANKVRLEHTETDDRAGLIAAFLEKLVTPNWHTLGAADRALALEDGGPGGTVPRTTVCVHEIWSECLGNRKEDLGRVQSRELNDIMRTMDGWVEAEGTMTFGEYGRQRYYVKE